MAGVDEPARIGDRTRTRIIDVAGGPCSSLCSPKPLGRSAPMFGLEVSDCHESSGDSVDSRVLSSLTLVVVGIMLPPYSKPQSGATILDEIQRR